MAPRHEAGGMRIFVSLWRPSPKGLDWEPKRGLKPLRGTTLPNGPRRPINWKRSWNWNDTAKGSSSASGTKTGIVKIQNWNPHRLTQN